LGVLGGAGLIEGVQDGYIFIAFRPDLLIPPERCKREVSALIARVKAVPRAPGVAEIRIPGENSARNRERLSREGLEIDQLVYDELHRLAGNRP
jgi:LDH2 family malate/lactate/ureidoglycolate dehydrogenase